MEPRSIFNQLIGIALFFLLQPPIILLYFDNYFFLFRPHRKLEAYADFNDDTSDAQAAKRNKGQDNSASTADLSRLVAAKLKKPKVRTVFKLSHFISPRLLGTREFGCFLHTLHEI